MAKVIPFRGIFYDKEKVKADDVIAPPYDVITPELREMLYERSPFNIIRIDAGREMAGDNETENKYSRAARYLREWLEKGILLRGEKPAFYVYRMDYKIKGQVKSLTGFFGLVRLEDLGKGIYPHECTHSKPKHDRLALMEVSSANTSPIFSLYNSPEMKASAVLAEVAKDSPYMQAKDMEGTVHSLWLLEDASAIEIIKADLADKAVFIADGHHRYETALDYQKAMRQRLGSGGDEPFDYVLMFLANIADGDLTVLPTHRLVNADIGNDISKKLSGYFEIDKLSSDADIISIIEGLDHAFGLYVGGSQYVLKYRGGDLENIHPALKQLDVIILHKMIFERLLGVSDYAYEMDYTVAKAKVDSGAYKAAFFLKSTPVKAVEEVALSAQRMPPKSTYFYPKVPTGLIINSLKSF
jgi:uncharacterized protein (DUF1015 family)